MTLLGWLCRVYSLLLRAYPAEFRERYEAEMARVFRDRGLEIAHSRGPWGLIGYALSTGEDWVLTVLRERLASVQIPVFAILNWAFLFCLFADFQMLKDLATHGTPSARAPFGLLIMYGLLWAFANFENVWRITFQIGVSWGLVSGIILTAWTAIGEYFFSRSDGHGPTALFLASASMVMMFACWSVAGYSAGRRTSTTSSGWLAGCWSGVVCALVKVTCALLLLKMQWHGPSIWMVLAAANQHLLEAPVIGAVFGAIAGRISLRRTSRPQLGLAGGK